MTCKVCGKPLLTRGEVCSKECLVKYKQWAVLKPKEQRKERVTMAEADEVPAQMEGERFIDYCFRRKKWQIRRDTLFLMDKGWL